MSGRIFLTDPELAYADDPIPGPLLAMGAAVGGIREFLTVAALVAERDQIEARLNADVQDWQRAVLPPAWVIVETPAELQPLTIYGHLLDDASIAAAETEAGSGPAETARTVARIADARRRGWLYGRWYSRIEPAGEGGTWHRSLLRTVLTDDEAAAARAAGWPERPAT